VFREGWKTGFGFQPFVLSRSAGQTPRKRVSSLPGITGKKICGKSSCQCFLTPTAGNALVRATCNALPSAMVGSGQPPSLFDYVVYSFKTVARA
jgi:hypothetical protein